MEKVAPMNRRFAVRSGRPGRGARTLAGFACGLCLLTLARCPVAAATVPPPDAERHWAFQPLRMSSPPAVKNRGWPKTDLDRFILAKIEAAGLAPARPAEARTLIRRMTFDLTGLPPTLPEVEQFARAMAANREEAVAQLAGRLLATPRYGERWGRHWLDVARYSDTKGYVYGREERTFVHAPAYRDWVIRAFNDDLPYDRFLLLQLAADQVAPAGSPDWSAMGFVTGGRRFLGVTHDIIDDRIDVVTRGTLGLTVACARCHDHKYDPIPTADYYSLYGVFHGSDERLVPLAAPGDKELAARRQKFEDQVAKRRGEASARLRARAGDYLAAQLELKNYPEEGFDQLLSADDLIPFSVRRWRDYLRRTEGGADPIFAPWHALVRLQETPEAEWGKAASTAMAPVLARPNLNGRVARAFAIPPASLREAAGRYGQLLKTADEEWKAALAEARTNKVSPPMGLVGEAAEALRRFLYDPNSPTVVPDTGMANTEFFFPTTICEELWKLQGEVDRRLIALGTPAALILADREAEPKPRIFIRGSASRPGDEVPRQFLKVLAGAQRQPFRRGSGRLELARAIASADNPLTARVMVNRLWQHHFGVGLVRTPSDFGLRAEVPGHPELLDWLAGRFIAEGWSVKAMHRLMVTSAVYQQDSESGQTERRGSGESPDPENRLLAHFPIHRLEFEALRDAMLAASGELDLTMGGRARELLDAGNQRRTVYALVDRQFLPGTFRTFDFANPDIHVAVRHETTVPQQALFFLNGTFAAHCAKSLAKRFAASPPKVRVRQLHEALYQRPATRREVAAALQFIQAAAADQPSPPPPVRETPWRYGTGQYDEDGKRVTSFKALTHFTGAAWQGGAQLPGGESGWAQLTAEGGHPGNTRTQACVRRWIAPRAAMVDITGLLQHEPEPGDGVRAFIVSDRQGELKRAAVHHGKADLAIRGLTVRAGETLDFVVDIGDTLSYDQFLWVPTVTAGGAKWDARADFTGPAAPALLLTAWEQYAQVLLLANEFAFVD